MSPAPDIAANIALVRRRIDAAARRVHRTPSDITLVAVSKTFSVDLIQQAAAAGQHAFGENRVQEGAAKAETLAALGADWHLIGHLQSNKARKAVAAFGWIQSVDSLDLIARLDAAASTLGVRPRVLIQVDLAHEATKHGIDAPEAARLAEAVLEARSLDLRGLMTVPPFPEDPDDSRPWFQRLRTLRDDMVAKGLPADNLRDLSMGMSHDFEVAIEEGATIVRVGTAIFGYRPPVAPA